MISIIIPLKSDQGYLQPCLDACFQNSGVEMEVIVLPDESLPFDDPRIRVEATGPLSPAKKRNRGAELARGNILAFIDDDTRPLNGWLSAAIRHFDNPKTAAVGGPSITPSDDPFWAQVSGTVYESWMMSGSETYRYLPQKERDVDDFPSCNLLVRKSTFDEIGGFGTDFWPGEDTELCLKLVQHGYRIVYEPEAMIEHHRRPSLKKHLIQLGNYALHRGYFVKRYPETSRRFQYFVPSLCILIGLALLGQIFLMGDPKARWILGFFTLAYGVLNLYSLAQLDRKSKGVKAFAFAIIFLSHLIYGILFFKGLFASQLPEEKMRRMKKSRN